MTEIAPQLHLQWAGGRRFDAGRPGRPALRLDGTGETGQSPMDALLSALATCTSIDVVEILAKRRTPISAMRVDIGGERVEETPRRYRRIAIHFTIAGDGIERTQAERAIALSLEKYCSVRASLREDIAVDWTLALTPAEGNAVTETGDGTLR